MIQLNFILSALDKFHRPDQSHLQEKCQFTIHLLSNERLSIKMIKKQENKEIVKFMKNESTSFQEDESSLIINQIDQSQIKSLYRNMTTQICAQPLSQKRGLFDLYQKKEEDFGLDLIGGLIVYNQIMNHKIFLSSLHSIIKTNPSIRFPIPEKINICLKSTDQNHINQSYFINNPISTYFLHKNITYAFARGWKNTTKMYQSQRILDLKQKVEKGEKGEKVEKVEKVENVDKVEKVEKVEEEKSNKETKQKSDDSGVDDSLKEYLAKNNLKLVIIDKVKIGNNFDKFIKEKKESQKIKEDEQSLKKHLKDQKQNKQNLTQKMSPENTSSHETKQSKEKADKQKEEQNIFFRFFPEYQIVSKLRDGSISNEQLGFVLHYISGKGLKTESYEQENIKRIYSKFKVELENGSFEKDPYFRYINDRLPGVCESISEEDFVGIVKFSKLISGKTLLVLVSVLILNLIVTYVWIKYLMSWLREMRQKASGQTATANE